MAPEPAGLSVPRWLSQASPKSGISRKLLLAYLPDLVGDAVDFYGRPRVLQIVGFALGSQVGRVSVEIVRSESKLPDREEDRVPVIPVFQFLEVAVACRP